jgi:hypothetical protein
MKKLAARRDIAAVLGRSRFRYPQARVTQRATATEDVQLAVAPRL